MNTRNNLAKIAPPNQSTSQIEFNPEDLENNFYENIVDTVHEPLLILDKDLRVVKASKSFLNFFKVSSDETIGKLIYDLGNKQWDIPKLRELLETILPEKNSFDAYEVKHYFKTIGKRTMLLNARQIIRAYGKDKIILLAIEDITNRKKAEESLAEKNRLNNEYLHILLEHANTPIIVWDSALRIKRFNHEFEKLSGFNSSEVIDKPIEILFPKDKTDSMIGLLKNNLNDNNSEAIEIDILTKDKIIKTVLWNSISIFDDDDKNIVATITQDITSRKQEENRLGLLETRYRRLFESAKDGILILDANTGKIIDVNPFLIDLLKSSKEKLVDKELWEIGFFKDIAANKEKFLELQKIKYVRYENLPLETTDGRKINVEFVSNVYFVNERKVIQCNIRDITERKQAEELLQETEERYRSFFENSMDGILLTSPDGKIISVNQAACKMFGYTENELINLGRSGIVDTSDPNLSFLLVERAEKGKVRCELTFIRKDGKHFPCEISSAMFKNREGSELTSTIIRDITERKHYESELLISEERYKAIFNNSLELIYIIDLEGQVLEANVYALNLLDYTLEDLKSLKFSDILDPIDLPVASKNIEYLVENGINKGLQEYRIRTKKGEIIIIETTSFRLDRDGKPYAVMGISRNITDRKHNEIAMIKAKEKAEESDKMKSEFLAQMSHEIRTPLNAVLGYVDYISDLFGEPKGSEIVECFSGVNLASNRIIRTIDLLLNASELQTGHYKPHFSKIDLDKDILNKLYKEQLLNANQRELELIYNCELNDPKIFADDYSTTQIFANLIDNAIIYTKKGKIEILLTKNKDGNVVVEIKDTGIGITEEFIPKLFNPFTQEEQGYSRSFEGNGLGLALVKNYCDVNNASIEVESVKNVGSTFRIIFDKKFTVKVN